MRKRKLFLAGQWTDGLLPQMECLPLLRPVPISVGKLTFGEQKLNWTKLEFNFNTTRPRGAKYW